MDAPPVDPVWLAHAKIIIAAACGGMVRLLYKPAESIIKSIWLLFGCITCGFYSTPILISRFDLNAVDYAGAIGAATGFIGLSVAGGVLKAVDAFDFRALMQRWTGTGQ